MPRRWFCLMACALVTVIVAGDAVAVSYRGEWRAVPRSAQGELVCPLPEETALLELINAHREVNGRQPLALSAALSAAARHHAESMASFDYFDYLLIPEGIDFAQNIANFGYEGTYLGANIAAGPSSDRAATVFSQWLASPSQRDNLLNPGFHAIGLGSASNPDASFSHYWAAAFGERADDSIEQGCDSPAPNGTTESDAERQTATVEPIEPSVTIPAETAEVTESASTATPGETVAPTGTAVTITTASPPPSPDVTSIITISVTPPGPSTPAVAANETPSVNPVASPMISPDSAASPVAKVSCTANVTSVRAADRVKVACAGFDPSEGLALYWDQPRDENLFTRGDADADGAGELSFLVPEAPAGPYVVIVRGDETRATATLTLEVRPGLFLLPETGDPGDVVTADLTGFQPGEAVTLNWNVDDTETRVLRVVTVGEDGSLTTTFRAPASPAGPHEVSAVGISGGRAAATFAIEES